MQRVKRSVEEEQQNLFKKDPDDILNNFINGTISIIPLLNSQTLSPKQLMTSIALIHKACMSTNETNLVAILLCKLASCKDYFITAVSVLAGKRLADVEAIEKDFLEIVVDLLQMLVEKVPTASLNILEILLPQLSEVCKKCSNGEDIFNKLEELEKQKERSIAVIKNAEKSAKSIAAPCDFRLLPNIPSNEEMFMDNPFLRPAIIDGPFSDVEEYLDVHFRLMREDMFRDFRKCLSDIHCHKKLENGRLYHNAYIVKIEQTPNGKLFCFAVPVRSRVDWKKTKRLGPGSLLCLSCDGFRSFYFASIDFRKDDGHNGNICYLALSFDATNEPVHFLTFYDVIEAGGYYESYSHIFKNLKKLNNETFPFETYLLNYENCNNIPFSLDPEQEIQLKEFQAEIKDENQNRAFELALRNKIALIQGPPGTGKSYLGTQIARYLIQVTDIRKPVIVMCYTNHALDQFLEKMLDFTTKVVRIGGRSKNEKLKNYNLNNLRRKDENLNRRYGDLKRESVIISQYLDSRMMMMAFPFLQTMNLRLGDICGLRDALPNGRLKGKIFDVVLSKSDNIKLYHWLMTDQSFSNIYDGMKDFKKILAEELFDAFQLKYILKKEECEETSASKLDHLAVLLIRLCLNDGHNSFFNMYNINHKEVDNFIHTYLTSDKDVFSLFYRAAVRCCEKNCTIVNEQCDDLWMLDLNERWKLLSIILFEVSSMNVNAELSWKPFTQKDTRMNLRWHPIHVPKYFRIETFERECKNLNLLQINHDARLLQGVDFIGLTTTGAAKNFDLLKIIGPTTYIVEEAAEVFESHIVASLVSNIEHLILIGDHFQLRPSPTVYDLGVKYNLDVSLFERLFKNGVPSECLKVQHRMRPGIAKLMVPEFYRSLANHPSVLEYENVSGVSSNVFFLSHSKLENTDDELKSHSNSYEASLIVTLCEYLVGQGHETSSITMLTTYVGQLYLIQRNMQGKKNLKGVLATTVDNYQGEENDIILVSFVRSNTANKVGFIKTHNRLCVALSRAHKGLYCIGNFNMFASQSKIWQSLITKLTDMGSFGKKLQINCYNHPEKKYFVTTPTDLQKHIREGCSEFCDELLYCGHKCDSLCHTHETEHSSKLCNRKCRQEVLCLEKDDVEITNLRRPYENDTQYVEDTIQSNIVYATNKSVDLLDISNNSTHNVIEPSAHSPCITNELSADFLSDANVLLVNPSHIAIEHAAVSLHDGNERPTDSLHDASESPSDVLCAAANALSEDSLHDAIKPPACSHHVATTPPAYSHLVANKFADLLHGENEPPTNSPHNSNAAFVNLLQSTDELPTDLLHTLNESSVSLLDKNESGADHVNDKPVDLLCSAVSVNPLHIANELTDSLYDVKVSAAKSLYSANELPSDLFHAVSEFPADLHDKDGSTANLHHTVNDSPVNLHDKDEPTANLLHAFNNSPADPHDKNEPIASSLLVTNEVPTDSLHVTSEVYFDSNCNGSLVDITHSAPFENAVEFDSSSSSNGKGSITEDNICDLKVAIQLNKSHQQKRVIIMPCGHKIMPGSNSIFSELQKAKCEEIVTSQMQCGEIIYHVCGDEASHENCSCPSLLPCGHTAPCSTNLDLYVCSENVSKPLQCGHHTIVSCHKSEYQIRRKCIERIEINLPCGHSMLVPCHKSKFKGLICKVETEVTLLCGHNLLLPCHKSKMKKFRECRVEIQQNLSCGHNMILPCHKSKIKKFRECTVKVQRTLSCGHNISFPCHKSEIMKFSRCNVEVQDTLSCGHNILFPCHKSKLMKISTCKMVVQCTLPCGHSVSMPCYKSKFEFKPCSVNVTITLPCGHNLTFPCHESNQKNIKCLEKIETTLSCGHNALVHCHKSNDQSIACIKIVKVNLSCGHDKSVACYKSKHEDLKCTILVTVTLPCNHPCKVPCFAKNSLDGIKCQKTCGSHLPCQHKCREICSKCSSSGKHATNCHDRCGSRLPCHHNCVGICGKCSSSGKHAICRSAVKRPLPCGHIFETKCNTPFTFCRQRCMYRCAHERCFNPCYVACFPCKKPCAWNCKHYHCDKLCNELCERPPCDKPCAKLNPSCGHPCSGFCGEPCPTLCYLCKGKTTHKREKLILLEDCGHCIPHIELSNFLTNRKFQGCPNCPRCNVPITKNFHFGNIVKTYYMSRNEINSKHMTDFPMIQFFQPYISHFLFEEHVAMIWNELQMGKFLEHEIYVSRMEVAHQLNVLFCMNEVQKFLKSDADSQELYDSLRSNKESNNYIKAQIFKNGALLFIQNATAETQVFSKIRRVNEICEDIMGFLRTTLFNNEILEKIMEAINSACDLGCPNLTALGKFLKELSSAVA